jgi:hypothetical protein
MWCGSGTVVLRQSDRYRPSGSRIRRRLDRAEPAAGQCGTPTAAGGVTGNHSAGEPYPRSQSGRPGQPAPRRLSRQCPLLEIVLTAADLVAWAKPIGVSHGVKELPALGKPAHPRRRGEVQHTQTENIYYTSQSALHHSSHQRERKIEGSTRVTRAAGRSAPRPRPRPPRWGSSASP